MSISIVTNVNSLVAQENLRVNSEFQGRTIQRLTSGYRINSSGDDAAGLGVANKLRGDVAELKQGVRNANDGISTLQIIDGGLNNVSKMLDRLKTLATQSASATFTGNRATLNDEYQKLLTEVNRQAANVGLGTGSVGGRYNTNISVYVGGGGDTQANSKVQIDLSGTGNRVDAAALGLSGTSVAAGGATEVANSAVMSTGTFMVSDTQDFTFSVAKAGSPAFDVTVTITGGSAGLSGDDIVSQFNDALSTHGISASLSSNGKLQFSGSTAFTMRATDSSDMLTANATLENNSNYKVNGAADYAEVSGADTETLTFTVGSQSTQVVLNATTGNTLTNALNTLNNAVNSLGIYAVKNTAGTGIDFQSSADFTLAGAVTAGNQGVFAGAHASASATDPTSSSGVTSSAESAINAIQDAITNLGNVQGKVGTAQNKLGYAIQLAQSQIASFSAAESRIRDADIASEAANMTKAQVMQQASLAAMAQANSAPQAVLALLRG